MAKRTFLDEGEKKAPSLHRPAEAAWSFRFVLPYRWDITVGIISLFLSSATLLSFPFFCRQTSRWWHRQNEFHFYHDHPKSGLP